MHVLESFALNTGLKIDKPYIYEKFIPLSINEDEKYIIVHPYTDSKSKNYKYWTETLNILISLFRDTKYKILLLGEVANLNPNDVIVQTLPDYAQLAFLIKRCEAFVGTDSIGTQIASSYNKKLLSIHSNFPPENTGPYWGDEKNKRIIDVSKVNGLPSYSDDEKDPKAINTIKPEQIAKEICELINLKYEYPYKTLYIGKEYTNRKVELIPESYLLNYQDFMIDSVIVRMDLHYNLSALEKQLTISSCSLVTNKPIDTKLIEKYKSRITELIYFVEGKLSEEESQFYDALRSLGVVYHLASRLTGDDLNKFKLDYLDYPPILEIPYGDKSDVEEKIKDKSNIHYKSSSLIVKGTKFYDNLLLDSHGNREISTIISEPKPVIDEEVFWRGLSNMMILEKTS